MAKRLYENEYPSVTTVLGVLRKIGLENWFKFNTAQFCNQESSRGKQIGKEAHEAIERYINQESIKFETEHVAEVSNALKSFIDFKQSRPELKLKISEIQLTSQKHKYNGTLDCLGEENGDLLIVDWKTGKTDKKNLVPPIYDEYLYQVSAYVKAYNEQENANITKAIIVALDKNSICYNIKTMDLTEINDCFEQAFLPALSIYNFQRRKK